MRFGEQIKSLRTERGLTQEQMAEALHVTRQAVSNWENDRNLPDIEMLLAIASTFHLSLDQLLMKDATMNDLTKKLIRDGSETRRAKIDLLSVCIGAALLLIGAALLFLKAVSVEYIDANGILHENFFLLPLAFLFLFGGFVAFAVTGVRGAVAVCRDKTAGARRTLGVSAGVMLLLIGGLLLLLAGNSGAQTTPFGFAALFCSAACFVWAAWRPRKK